MYTIEITKTEVEEVATREYEKVGMENGEPKYGYVTGSKMDKVSRVIYLQTLEEIDIKDIIEAINQQL